MAKNINREETLRIAAERMRQKREKEEREDREFYERITSGRPWFIFKIVTVFCTLMLFVSTIEVFVDGPTKELTEEEWRVDHGWEYPWHMVLDVEGYMFTPKLEYWTERVENTLEITYSPIFRTGKKLSFDYSTDGFGVKKYVSIRKRSIFTWFPAFQILLLIPLITFIFRQQSAWFNFARIASLYFVFPGTLMVIFFALM